ncbi:MAG: hypothetical protein AAGF12_29805 [Myxococcota bacterium]
MDDDPPAIRVANALFLILIRRSAELLRVSPDGTAELRSADTPWVAEVKLPPKLIAGAVARIFEIANIEPSIDEPTFGRATLGLGANRREHFLVYGRPSGEDVKVIVYHVSKAMVEQAWLSPSEELEEEVARIGAAHGADSAKIRFQRLLGHFRGRGRQDRSTLASLLSDLHGREPARSLELASSLERLAGRHSGTGWILIHALLLRGTALVELGRIREGLTQVQAAVTTGLSLAPLDLALVDLHIAAANVFDRANCPLRAVTHREAACRFLREIVGPDDNELETVCG